jgi:hypothetical protein
MREAQTSRFSFLVSDPKQAQIAEDSIETDRRYIAVLLQWVLSR